MQHCSANTSILFNLTTTSTTTIYIYNNTAYDYNPENNSYYFSPVPTVQAHEGEGGSSSSSAQHNQLQHFYPSPTNSNSTKNNENDRTEVEENDHTDTTTRLTNQDFIFAPFGAAAQHGAVAVRNNNNRNRASNAILRTSESTPTTTRKGVAAEPRRVRFHCDNNNYKMITQMDSYQDMGYTKITIPGAERAGKGESRERRANVIIGNKRGVKKEGKGKKKIGTTIKRVRVIFY